MSGRGVFDQTPKAPIRRLGVKVKKIKVITMVITTERVIMSKMEITIVTTTSAGVTMVTEKIRVGPIVHLKIVNLLQEIVEVSWRELRICCRK